MFREGPMSLSIRVIVLTLTHYTLLETQLFVLVRLGARAFAPSIPTETRNGAEIYFHFSFLCHIIRCACVDLDSTQP